MKGFIITTDVNGGEYTSMCKIECETSAEMIDDFTILIDEKIKIAFDERIESIRRILK